MNFNEHSDLVGQHAFLSASKHHWINYTDEKLISTFATSMDAQKGTELHEFAAFAIRLKQKLARSKKTLNAYVNDAVDLGMTPEQLLVYSRNAFGTADAILFEDDILRIHDLKTGTVVKGSMHQLEIYAAFFCLEYGYRPGDIRMILRIYQNDEIREHEPPVDQIAHIMSRIITFDSFIESLREETGR